MTQIILLQHKFVNYIPDALDDGVLYVSLPFATVMHKCCCGCGTEIVTPLDPSDWKMTFDGKSISLCPSIGNWSLDCQSHYWIDRNQVRWARLLSKSETRKGRILDHLRKARRGGDACMSFWRFLRRQLKRKTRI